MRAGRKTIPTRKQLREWCMDNCTGGWRMDYVPTEVLMDNSTGTKYYNNLAQIEFLKESDAVWFCLCCPGAQVVPNINDMA